MHPHEALLRRFYERLAARDADAPAAFYHPDIFFSDPLFPRLHGADAADAWRLRLACAGALQLALADVEADDRGARAAWTARYTFAPTGRTVETRVEALFAFRDGRIVRHHERFGLRAWMAGALGPAGAALGWLPPARWVLRRRAARALERLSAGPA